MQTPDDLPPLLLTPEEAARTLRVGRSTVYDLMRSERLVSVKVNGSRRIPLRALHLFIDALIEDRGAA